MTASRGNWIPLGLSCIALAVALLIGIPSRLREAAQRRITGTMVDIRKIGDALESYAKDHGSYPSSPHMLVTEQHFPAPKADQWRPPSAWPVGIEQRIDALRSILSTRSSGLLPATDRWGHPYLYATTADRQKYTIVSTGPDGKLASVHTGIWYPEDTDRDLVFADGVFVDRLEGTCSQPSQFVRRDN